MHLDEEGIQRLLHGELPLSDEPLIRGHLGVCPECRSKLDEAEKEEAWVSQRLRRLDHKQPPVTVESVLAAHPARLPAWGRWAAGFILTLVVAGAAYALPGSPLPRLLSRIIQLIHQTPAPAPKGARPYGSLDGRAGIAVNPGGRLIIALRAGRAGDTALLSLTNRADVEVRARGGVVTFTSDPDRLTIVNQGTSTRFEIMIPRAARSIEIRVGSRPIWSKQGSRIVTNARRDSRGRYLLSLTSSHSPSGGNRSGRLQR